MSSKLAPSDPSSCMVIRQITPNITTLSLPFARFSRIKIGGRATLVRLPSGSLAIFSPVALTPEVKDTVASLGTLKYIAALDFEHHLFVGPWHAEYPDAKVIGPEGLKEKRAKMPEVEPVRFDVEFRNDGRGSTLLTGQNPGEREGYTVDEEFDAEFDRAYVPAHANKELVFNFKRDRTLIAADLMFNLPATEQYSRSEESPHTGFLTQLMNKINGTGGGQIGWQKRFLWYAISSGDRAGFGRSVQEIEGWDFDRIVPCHGDVIESGAKGVFRNLFGWHLKMRGT